MHARPLLTVEAYFALEAAETEHRHEYWDGDIWAMAGSTPEHNDIVHDLTQQLKTALRTGTCRAHSESIRTRLDAHRYVYPDVVVGCPPAFDRSKSPPTLVNPTLVIEVLSEFTSNFDRGEKLRAYQRVETIREIVLVSSFDVDVVHYARTEDGWRLRNVERSTPLALSSLDATLDLAAAYRSAGM